MDTKHEALLQHYLHRRLQEMHNFNATLAQPSFMSPAGLLPHLYSSVFVGGATEEEEIPTDLTCRRRQLYPETSQSRLPPNALTTTGILLSNASDTYKGSASDNNTPDTGVNKDWQQSSTSQQQVNNNNNEGVATGPGAHAMLSAPPVAAAPSPFRSPGNGGGGVRTTPWPATAHAPEGFGRFAVGGSVYSLFPSLPSATEASAIYSQASNSPGGRFGGQSTATTFHSFLSAQKAGDTLFSAGFPLTPNSIPSNSPQQHQLFGASTAGLSPVTHLTSLEAERGVAQLELMARGFTGVRRAEETKEERKTRSRQTAKEKRQSKKIRDTLAENERKQNSLNNNNNNNNNNKIYDNSRLHNGNVKTERASCGCANVRSSAPAAVVTITTSSPSSSHNSPPQLTTSGRGDLINIPMFPSPHTMPPMSPSIPRGESETRQNGGCSRTIPMPPRSRSSDSTNKPGSPATFTPITIKKEVVSTPCQVAEVTTSRTALAPSSPARQVLDQGTKVANNNNNNNNLLTISAPVDVTGIVPVHTIKTEPLSDVVRDCSPGVVRKEVSSESGFATSQLQQQQQQQSIPSHASGSSVARQRSSEQSSTLCMRTEQPSALCMRTEQSNTLCVRTEQPNTMCIRAEQPSAMCMRTEQPNTMCIRTEQPGTLCVRTEQSNTMCMRAEQPSTLCMRTTEQPNTLCMRTEQPSTLCMRTDQSNTMCNEMGSKSRPVLAPAPPDKPRDDFRVLLPSRGRPAVSSSCVLTSVSSPAVSVQAAMQAAACTSAAMQAACSSAVTLHTADQQRTTTLTIPASSIVLHTANNSTPGATMTTNTATLQVQTTGMSSTSCDEAVALAARLTNQIPPWTQHNSALTPPTLWLGQPQYQTGPSVPVQLESAPPALPPLPPVGLQLVRDPISGHLLLLPAASLEHLQRAAAVQVWPSTTSGFQAGTTSQHHLPQLMLHQAAPQAPPAPQTQHITLFQQAPNNPPQASAPAPQPQETEFRILIPPQQHGQPTQLALIHEAVKSKKPGEVMEGPKLELLDTMAKLLPDMSGPVTPSSFPASFVFPQSAPQSAPAQQPQQLQYFYEQLTGAVQIAPHTSIAAVAPPVIDTGRRSQGTSPANPAEGCLTPPPESSSPAAAACAERVAVSAAPEPEEAAQENTADSSSSCAPEVAAEEASSGGEVSVQDASNQTETPPVSEDENTRDESMELEEETVQVEAPPAPAPPAPAPVDVSGLELLSNSIEQFTQREKQAEQESCKLADVTPAPELAPVPIPEPAPAPAPAPAPQVTEMVGGLGLLCALAEQRFMEDIETAEKEKDKLISTPVKTKEKRIDINRNYKSPKSEREIKKFIASKVSQYSEQSSSHSSNSDSTSTDFMDAMELDMRMRLAELQRKYKEKQKELSKLQHSARRSTTSDDGSNSPGKRGPGRPRKRKLSSVSSPQSPRSSKATSKERSPISETSVSSPEEQDTPKLKSTKDILKPPTLTANKILTSAKFKPSSTTCLSSKFKLPACNVNVVKLKSAPAKVKPTKSTEETAEDTPPEHVGALSSCTSGGASEAQHWLTGGYFRRAPCPATSRKSITSTSTRPPQPLSGYTFGSKQLTPSLLSGGEKQRLESLTSDSIFWFLKPETKNKDTPPASTAEVAPHQFGALPPSATAGGEKRKLLSSSEAESDPESSSTPSSLFSPAAVSTTTSSSSKKRKPGRPKRRAPSRQDEEATETIVAKKPKSISFLLSPPSPPSLGASSLHKPKIKPKLKAEAKVKSSLSCDDEEDTWPRRTLESKREAWNNEPEKPKHGLDAATRLAGVKKRVLSGGASNVVPPKVRSCSGGNKQQQQRSSSSEARAKKLADKPKVSPSEEQVEAEVESSVVVTEPSCDVITVQDQASTSVGPPSCALTQDDLEGEPRALAVMGGLVYAGHVTAIRAPDVYGITLDGERGNRPHIFCREEMLKEAIREVKPRSTSEVPPGTRVCAYWSQQYRCLYPGTVATPTSPDPQSDLSFVNVEFDDGDSGRIHLEDIRMLPRDFPIVEYDPNPLMSLAKRRRRASGASSTEGRRTSSETPLNTSDDLPAPSPGPAAEPTVTQPKPEEESKQCTTETKASTDSTTTVATKPVDEEERERRRQKKREKAKKKEKLRKLLARGVAALGKLPNRKKHKKRRCEDRHHHKHHHRHRKHRHHRHDKSRSTETSSSPASSSPAPEPATPELPQPEPEVVLEQEEERPPTPQQLTKKAKNAEVKAKKRQERQSSAESRSKMAAFLPARQLWRWAGRGYKRPGAKGRGKKEFFKSIQRGKETINVGDCAVFLSTGRPDRPYIGRIETMWESWGGNMVVRVKWFYHPEETQGGEGIDKLKYPGALFQSPHADENDVQTISHRCEVLALSEYTRRLGKEPSRYTTIYDNNDIYYLAGSYDPTAGVLTMEQGVTSP